MESSRPKAPINLMRGWPAVSALPTDLLTKASAAILSDPSISTPALEYGPDAGYLPLRKAMSRWLSRHFNVEEDVDRICITGGASQSIANILISYADPLVTKGFWVVAPCYHLVCPIFEDAGFARRLRGIREDEHGIDPVELEAEIQRLERSERNAPDQLPSKDVPGRKLYRHIIYVVSTSSNPSGKTLPLERRTALVKLARKYDALLISDDVYDFLQWPLSRSSPLDWTSEMRLPRLADIDRELGVEGFGNAVSNGSFSKIAAPGLRTGWIEASPAFATGMSMQGSTKSGGAPSQFSAAVLSVMVQDGSLERHVDEVIRPQLRDRHLSLIAAIKESIPQARINASSHAGAKVFGGFFVWFTVDIGLSTQLVAQAALEEENLVIGSGGIFAVHGDKSGPQFDDKIRLCFAWEPVDCLIEGVKRLANLLDRMERNKELYQKTYTQSMGQDWVTANK
ncbi:pyridoxal phosphate-dependent transferase [Emericellopsis atlantica]|uniref:Pyridoxal phosphate-dependent transferase n=1 Tax=Emericellopsis atlantica TaxID=2614577 RepID=A0A9P7ZHM2_9HYPO|nr:pyridoxal phosphate-dependent transferase [Emericellopsis atlantica]KAG9251837.1 pyridoxal phosphate-dependent transferase [Emericellopsis atlantica]